MADDTQNFDDTLIGRESRESTYRTWSERAVIVGFNAETESYDIVITTEKTLGDNIRSLNRTIRNVKAVIDPNTDVFLPGESVIVGYVDDRREHPVIVGLGDSSGHTCIKVTLSVDSNIPPTIEGPTAPSIEDPVFELTPCPSNEFLQDSLTGSTTTLTIDCDSLDIFGCFRVQVEAPSGCGCGVYDWSLSGGAGFTISDQGELASAVGLTTTLAPFGIGNNKLKICPPTNNPSVSGNAYRKTWGHCTSGLGATNCSGGGNNAVSSNQPFRCDDSVAASCNANAHISTDFCITFNYGGCSGGGPGDDILWCFSTVASASVFCGDNDDQDLLDICDERSQAMIDAGCAPCRLAMADTILTATDACGVQRSIIIEVEV